MLAAAGLACRLQVLAGALSDLGERGVAGALFSRVQVRTINPKSVTMGQLYGENDKATQEWKDGVLAVTFRCARARACVWGERALPSRPAHASTGLHALQALPLPPRPSDAAPLT